MALKNLFDMAKADRYTADGREALIKAQEAETEDATRRTYQIGEISQATGLQKTANGWVKPKKGKQAGAKKQEAGTKHPPMVMPKGMSPAEFMKAWEDDAKKNGFKKGQGNEWREHLRKEEAESKPAAQEVKLGGGADTYYFEDPDNMSNEDKVFKSLGIELAETFGDHDGEPGNTETWANGWLDNIMDNGGLGIKSKKTRQPAAPVPAEEVMRIVEENPARWNRIIGNAKKFYEGKGRSTDFESDEFYPIKMVGGKTKPSAQYYAEGKRNEKNNPLTGKYVTQRQNTSKDAAPSLSEIVDRVYNIGEISEKTGLQKTANGWRPVKKGAAGKTSRANKEEAIRKDLGLTAGEDMSRFSDEQIEKMYAKTQQTPEQQKADFDKSKIGQAVNKGRQEFAAEKTRQKELASKTNAIGLPKENKPGAGIPTYKESDFIGKTYGDFAKTLPRGQYTITRNQENPDGSSENDFTDIKHGGKKITVKFDKEGKITSVKQHENPTRSYQVGASNQATETKPAENKPAADFTKYKRDTGLNLYGKSAQEGEQYMKENGFELQPESRPDRKIYKNGFGEKYEASYTPEGVFNGGSHSNAPIPGRDNHRAYQEGLGNKYLGQKKREDGTVTQVYLTPEGKYERSDFTAKGEYNGGSTSSEEFYKKWYNDDLEDAAPKIRQLTGDCRIRIRKEKPALTGDTKIRVRK